MLNKVILLFFGKKISLKFNAIDVYQRYKAVSNKIHDEEKKIIEIGAAYSVLHHFVNKTHFLTYVDINQEYQPPQGIKYFCITDEKLPFKDKEFDCLVSIATLEHIPQEKRRLAVKEWKRIAKRIIIYVPVGQIAQEYDLKLFNWKKYIGVYDKWTEEHIRYGLPTVKILHSYFKNGTFVYIQNASVWFITTFSSSIPVLGRFLPGLLYLFLRKKDCQEPYIGCVMDWK
ncbi:MAG: methyltransferase domain-containing protein [Candidatus Woesearchaeota archaeon]